MNYTFNDIAGFQTEKEELKRLCEVLSNRQKYLKKGQSCLRVSFSTARQGQVKRCLQRCLPMNAGYIHIVSILPK